MVEQIIVSMIAGLSFVLCAKGLGEIFSYFSHGFRHQKRLRRGAKLEFNHYGILQNFRLDMSSVDEPLYEFKHLAKRRRKARICAHVERHLPEFSETLLMGLRAGLSFDRAFSLYHNRFDDELAQLCAEAQKRWENGLMSREVSLTRLGEEAESELLVRLVTNINRSMKLGSSLVRTLEIFSSEARSCHKAKVEERIAKVAVKMMIPTTVCILPSMLILVLGPILLGMS